MSKNKLALLVVLLALLSFSLIYLVHVSQVGQIRVACVGDSLTQSSGYPFDLGDLLGNKYAVGNFGAGSTTVSLSSETPYMNTTAFQKALRFQPNIVIIMLGTNDAQPSLFKYNTTFVSDYQKLVDSFESIPINPKIWIVLPPPIFSNQTEKISAQYFSNTIIPNIEQVATENNLPTIDVYSALVNHPNYFYDGVHPNVAGAKIIANVIFEAITSGS